MFDNEKKDVGIKANRVRDEGELGENDDEKEGTYYCFFSRLYKGRASFS